MECNSTWIVKWIAFLVTFLNLSFASDRDIKRFRESEEILQINMNMTTYAAKVIFTLLDTWRAGLVIILYTIPEVLFIKYVQLH